MKFSDEAAIDARDRMDATRVIVIAARCSADEASSAVRDPSRRVFNAAVTRVSGDRDA